MGEQIHSDIGAQLRDGGGWFQGVIGNYIYNTIGNAAENTIREEEASGWTLEGLYAVGSYKRLSQYQKANLSVFKKELMSFFCDANPWADKRNLDWLPDLGYANPSNDRIQLTKSLGHNCPTIERKVVCSCGGDKFAVYRGGNDVSGRCITCGKETTIWRNDRSQIEYGPIQEHLVGQILVSIEYPVDSLGGDDFSWIQMEVKDAGNNLHEIVAGET